MFKIVKNTMSSGLNKKKIEVNKLLPLAMDRGIEYVRTCIIGSGVSDFPVKTGRAKNSIQGNPDQTGDSIKEIKQSGNSVKGLLGTAVPYVIFFEYGTSKMKGRFPITRGFNRAKPGLMDIFATTIRRGL